ncbi:MAG: hypothetical protein LBH47_03785, partial [Christensenellaceae bacterium]|nr:hypothetical protein [Christensenellaceae bacterium]
MTFPFEFKVPSLFTFDALFVLFVDGDRNHELFVLVVPEYTEPYPRHSPHAYTHLNISFLPCQKKFRSFFYY